MAKRPLPFWLINAFTTTSPHSGNQAGVVIFPKNDPRASDDEYKQRVAKDMNFSETAFLEPRGEDTWNLRWWTPAAEVTLCGHATLASARVLFFLDSNLEKIKFETRWAGDLYAERIDDGLYSTTIKIFLPIWSEETISNVTRRIEEDTSKLKSKSAAVLGIQEDDVEEVVFYKGDYEGTVTRIKSHVDLANLKPDIKSFLEFSPEMTIITQIDDTNSKDGRLSIKSRVHCPIFDVTEDPVTGSAHAYLTSYYLKTPVFEKVKSLLGDVRPEDVVIDALQVSDRGGKLELRLVENGKASIVGSASEMGTGTLSVW